MNNRIGWLKEEKRCHSIIGGFYASYNHYGSGLLESVYAGGLEKELMARGHQVAREVSVRVFYKGVVVGWQRLDFIIDNRIVLELKAGPVLPNIATTQLFNYLRATGLEIGFVLHYGNDPRFYRVYCERKPGFGPQNPA